jgi:hypothetical protein
MKPLSQRLEETAAFFGDDDAHGIGLMCREAAALAKRYEDAPTGHVDMACARDAVVVDELTETYPLLKQRVRIILDNQENE